MNVPEINIPELTQGLINRALTGKQSNFEFIRSYQELSIAQIYLKTLKKIIKAFKKTISILKKEYFSLLKEESVKAFACLCSLKRMSICLCFYKEEYSIIQHSIVEYYLYLSNGHRINAFLGGYREDKDLVDHTPAWFGTV